MSSCLPAILSSLSSNYEKIYSKNTGVTILPVTYPARDVILMTYILVLIGVLVKILK